MIAHTLSNCQKMQTKILVMGDGQIAESGTHEELLAKGGKYAAMWNAEQKNIGLIENKAAGVIPAEPNAILAQKSMNG